MGLITGEYQVYGVPGRLRPLARPWGAPGGRGCGVSVQPTSGWLAGLSGTGVLQATKKGASLRAAAARRGGLKSSTCNITVFEVFRYLVERSFSSHKLRSSFSRRQWQLALCAPPSLRRLVFSDLGVPRSLGLPVAGDVARRRARDRRPRSAAVCDLQGLCWRL